MPTKSMTLLRTLLPKRGEIGIALAERRIVFDIGLEAARRPLPRLRDDPAARRARHHGRGRHAAGHHVDYVVGGAPIRASLQALPCSSSGAVTVLANAEHLKEFAAHFGETVRIEFADSGPIAVFDPDKPRLIDLTGRCR